MKKIAIIILLLCLILLIGCGSRNPNDYTEQEHIERISACVQEHFMDEDNGYTSFNVYPLYNEKEEVVFYMVEFEPQEFIFIKLQEIAKGCDGVFTETFGNNSMYRYSEGGWRKYVGENNGEPVYETDENRNLIYYHKSPYKLAGVLNERKYLLLAQEAYVPAIKTQDKFVNLITIEEFSIENDSWKQEHEAKGVYINFIGKPQFNI